MENRNISVNFNGTLWVLIGVVLCILKGCGVLHWSWFVCTLPFWIWIPITVILVIIIVIIKEILD